MHNGTYTPICWPNGRAQRLGNTLENSEAWPKSKAAYELARGLGAFNLSGHASKGRNGAATWYDFPDGSRLVVYKVRNAIAWGPDRATLLAERTLFGGHTAAAHISI